MRKSISGWRLRGLLLVSSLALSAPAAMAGTDTGQLSVTATVQNGCHLDGGNLDFGTFTSGQASNLDVNGSIRYTNCIGSLTFALDGGLNPSGNLRQMTSGSGRLSYQIYRNSTRDTILGPGGSTQTQSLIGSTPQNGQILIYGRIPSGQIAPTGSYSDIVTITMTF